jgi:hypothetical protein
MAKLLKHFFIRANAFIFIFQHRNKAYYVNYICIHHNIAMFSIKTLYPGGIRTQVFCALRHAARA